MGWYSGALRWLGLGRMGEPAPAAEVVGGTFRRRGVLARVFRRGTDSGRVFRRRDGAGRVFRRATPMSAMPVISLPKDSNETVSYLFDFGNFPEVAAGETISSAAVPAVSGLTIGTPSVTAAERDGVEAGEGVQVTISGGTADADYAVECRATFSGGSIRVVKGIIEVE